MSYFIVALAFHKNFIIVLRCSRNNIMYKGFPFSDRKIIIYGYEDNSFQKWCAFLITFLTMRNEVILLDYNILKDSPEMGDMGYIFDRMWQTDVLRKWVYVLYIVKHQTRHVCISGIYCGKCSKIGTFSIFCENNN